MSKAMMALGVVMLGILMLLLVNIIQSYSTGDELDFSLLRDTTEAAMVDAVDISYYQTSGQVRMDKEKFVESFVKRFARNVNGDRYYNIRFYDLNETPPKASVKVGSSTTAVFAGENFDIRNAIDAILETKYADINTSKNILSNIEKNSNSKPSWWSSTSNNFGSSIVEDDDDDDDGEFEGDDDAWEPSFKEVKNYYLQNKKIFKDGKDLVDEDEFVDIMIMLFEEYKGRLNNYETSKIDDYARQLYGTLK